MDHNENRDTELLRIQIMKDVYEKIDKLMEKIHSKGCDFGLLEKQHRKDWVNMEYENMKDDLISKYGSVQAGQRLLFDDILPKMRTNIMDMTIRVSAVEIRLEEGISTISKLLKGAAVTFGIGILIMSATGGAKLWQDWLNQKQTAGFLTQLTSGDKIIMIKDGQITIKQGETP